MVAVIFIAVADVMTGQDVRMSEFYVLAVAFVAWFSTLRAAMVLACVCAAGGVLTDHLVSDPYLHFGTSFSSEAVPVWNGVSSWIIYTVAAYLVSSLRTTLRERTRLVDELQQANASIRTLEGLLPMCAWCRTIRDEQRGGAWVSFEAYIHSHTDAQFSHGICPTCAQKLVPHADAPAGEVADGERVSGNR